MTNRNFNVVSIMIARKQKHYNYPPEKNLVKPKILRPVRGLLDIILQLINLRLEDSDRVQTQWNAGW